MDGCNYHSRLHLIWTFAAPLSLESLAATRCNTSHLCHEVTEQRNHSSECSNSHCDMQHLAIVFWVLQQQANLVSIISCLAYSWQCRSQGSELLIATADMRKVTCGPAANFYGTQALRDSYKPWKLRSALTPGKHSATRAVSAQKFSSASINRRYTVVLLSDELQYCCLVTRIRLYLHAALRLMFAHMPTFGAGFSTSLALSSN